MSLIPAQQRRWPSSPLASLGLLLACSAVSACGPSKADVVQSVERAKASALEKELTQLESFVSQGRGDLAELRVKLRTIAYRAGDDLPDLQKKATDLINVAKESQEKAGLEAWERFEKSAREVRGKIEKASPDEIDARRQELEGVFSSFPDGYRARFAAKLIALRRELFQSSGGSQAVASALQRAQELVQQGFPDAACGVIEGTLLQPSVRDSPEASQLRNQLSKYEELVKKEGGAADQDKRVWQEILKDAKGLQNFQTALSESFLPKRDYVEVEVDKDAETAASLRTGDSEWTDLVLEIEFMIIRQGFSLVVRMKNDDTYDTINITRDDYDAQTWHRLRVKVAGNTARTINIFNLSSKETALNSSAGRIGLAFEAGSKVRLRLIRVSLPQS